MMGSSDDHADRIARALRTAGGHLAIGRSGFTLWYDRGCRLSGGDETDILAACRAAGLPVIDSRPVPFEALTQLVLSGSMVAVGEPPGAPPYHGLSYAPLAVVAAAYRAAGAVVLNLDPAEPGKQR